MINHRAYLNYRFQQHSLLDCLIGTFVQTGSSSIVWRWDGAKFRGLTTESTPIMESEGGFTISTFFPQDAIQFQNSNSNSEGIKQDFILVGSSHEKNDVLLYRARSDSVNG
jgi:hypothetical protein